MARLICSLKLLASGSAPKIIAFAQPIFESELVYCTLSADGKFLNGNSTKAPKVASGHSLNLFLFVEQDDGQKQFDMRAGSARVPVEQLLEGFTPFDFLDIEDNKVATCQAMLKSNPPEFHSAKGVTLPSTTDLITTTRDLIRKKNTSGSNVHQSLPSFDFIQVKQHIGYIPMWAFPLLNLTPKPQQRDPTNYLLNSLSNAMFLLGIDKLNPHNFAEMAEVLSEMQTLALRAQLYVIDFTTTGGGEHKQVDKWENSLVSPTPRLMSFDCEDATVRILQEAYWLLGSTKNDILKPLVEAERAYISFMVGMTLKLSPAATSGWCYHAAVLKLDRQYVMSRLFPDKEEADSNSRRPAVLLEGTNYTTGCWEYKSRFASPDALCERSQTTIDNNLETIAKITPGLINKKGLYGVIQSLFSPELAWRYGVVQIELGQNDRRGAFAGSVMQYDKRVQWTPIEVKGFQQTIETLYAEAYPSIEPPRFTGKPAAIAERRPAPDIDCLVRAVDYFSSEDTRERLASKLGKKKLTERVLKISDDLQIVHLSAS